MSELTEAQKQRADYDAADIRVVMAISLLLEGKSPGFVVTCLMAAGVPRRLAVKVTVFGQEGVAGHRGAAGALTDLERDVARIMVERETRAIETAQSAFSLRKGVELALRMPEDHLQKKLGLSRAEATRAWDAALDVMYRPKRARMPGLIGRLRRRVFGR